MTNFKRPQIRDRVLFRALRKKRLVLYLGYITEVINPAGISIYSVQYQAPSQQPGGEKQWVVLDYVPEDRIVMNYGYCASCTPLETVSS